MKPLSAWHPLGWLGGCQVLDGCLANGGFCLTGLLCLIGAPSTVREPGQRRLPLLNGALLLRTPLASQEIGY